jgi:hypothetical protein
MSSAKTSLAERGEWLAGGTSCVQADTTAITATQITVAQFKFDLMQQHPYRAV